MPCIAVARGITVTPPYVNVPMPFNDATDNNPCGKLIASSVNGVNTSAHSLCLWHLGLKIGLQDIQAPIVFT